MNEIADRIRVICAHLVYEPPGSARAAFYRAALKTAAAELETQQTQWNQPTEGDKHQDIARQSYRSRESDSAEGFSEGLKLFSPTKRDSDKEKK